jgi:hypothetical protein
MMSGVPCFFFIAGTINVDREANILGAVKPIT